MDQPVRIDVFYPLPEGWGLCLNLEALLADAELSGISGRRGLDEYPPEYREEVHRLGEWAAALSARFGKKVSIRIHDPRSFRAMLKALRHGVRRYPAFVIEGQGRVTGWHREALEERVERAIRLGPPPETKSARLFGLARRGLVVLGQMLYGMTVYEMVRDLNKNRGQLERMFVLITFGDLLGIPVLPPYYTMRLLPYVVPNINAWKHSLMRERDLTDLCDQEIT